MTDENIEPMAGEPDGWLQSGSLLYRLTDERYPHNCDEINVTMANGSRSDEARSARASELLAMLAVPTPTPPDQAGEPVTWQNAFDERHEFDDYPEHFMTGMKNEFCAGWHAALKAHESTAQTTGSAPVAGTLTIRDVQKKAIEYGFEYWRASDVHGVSGTKPQAIELLQDLLGVEVEIEDNGCSTCNGTGMIGGPSFCAPDEGGEPCPDCAAPPANAPAASVLTDATEIALTDALSKLIDKIQPGIDSGNIVDDAREAMRALDLDVAKEAIAIAKFAVEVMSEFHSHAEPDGTSDENPIFPAAAFKNFVDEHARLMFRVAQFKSSPVEPAYLRLRSAAQTVCDVLGYHGEICNRDDRVVALVDALYGTDDGSPEIAKAAYATSDDARSVADLPDFQPPDYSVADKAFWDATSMRKFAHAYADRIITARIGAEAGPWHATEIERLNFLLDDAKQHIEHLMTKIHS